MWYDKYLHWYQRKHVFDVYLKKDGYDEVLVVVLKNGTKGESLLDNGLRPVLAIQAAYENACRIAPDSIIKKSDYEKYLKPTLGTTRPDPLLVSNIEKGFYIER